MYALASGYARRGARAWYRVHVHGPPFPEGGALVCVMNHTNGMADAGLVMGVTDRPFRLLVKIGLVRMPILGTFMRALRAIPVYRRKDGADTSLNEEAFRAAHAALREGQVLALFPEGTSHGARDALRPFKTGAARIALGAEQSADFALGLGILPVGLHYRDRDGYRSRVDLWIGPPLRIAHLKEACARDPRAAATQLTAEIEAALRAVTVNLERAEDRPRLELAEAVLGPDGRHRPARLQALAELFDAGRIDPEPGARLDRLGARLAAHGLGAQDLGRLLSGERHGVRARRLLAQLALGAPLALLCLLAWGLPGLASRAAGRLARPSPDKYVTTTILAATVLLPAWLLGLTLAVGLAVGWPAALGCAFLLALAALLVPALWEQRYQPRIDLCALRLGPALLDLERECEELSAELEVAQLGVADLRPRAAPATGSEPVLPRPTS